MAKSIDERLQDAIKKRVKLEADKNNIIQKLSQNRERIKSLQQQKKKIENEAVLRKIEASGITLDDVFKIMEEKCNKGED
ncbi:MAG: hypothetical protein PHE79_10350 [Eubacteriales bacterium]|nr:hypothetical protein [Eubacteriales bacterium]